MTSFLVGSGAHSDAEDEPTARGIRQGCQLLGEDDRRVERREQDVGHQLDARGGTCGQRQGGDRIEARVDQSVDRGHGVESALFGAACTLDDQRSRDSGDVVGQSDANLHWVSFESS